MKKLNLPEVIFVKREELDEAETYLHAEEKATDLLEKDENIELGEYRLVNKYSAELVPNITVKK